MSSMNAASLRIAPVVLALLMGGGALGTLRHLAPSARSLLYWLLLAAIVAAVVLLGLALLLRSVTWLRRVWLLSVNGLVLGCLLGFGEVWCRWRQIDFEPNRDALREAYPICFRGPVEPLGEVYFKRPGGGEWTGKPLQIIQQLYGGTDGAYGDEKAFTSRYDAQGFRNPSGLADWDVVVVGDSFTEAGYLPYEQIFTAVAASHSGLRVKNLGVCNTGPFTHLSYLRAFGAAVSCRVAVLAFYEGNDVSDALEEVDALDQFGQTGARPYRELGPQTSLVQALYGLVKNRVPIPKGQKFANATTKDGRRISVPSPPVIMDLTSPASAERQVLSDILDLWKANTQQMKVQPVLLYLPLLNRCYHGLVEVDPTAPAAIRDWQPTALPEVVAEMCAARGIFFINAYPALRKVAESGKLIYNPVVDAHFNADGSAVVGQLLGQELKKLTKSMAQP
jgi:hypothetical protein